MELASKFKLSVILHGVSKGSTFLQTLIITPLLIKAIGPDIFGVLMICHSLLLWTMIDNGITESVKLLCIKNFHSEKSLKFQLLIGSMFKYYLTISLAISLIITFLLYLFASSSLVTLIDILNIFLISMLILPSKFIRDYLIGSSRSHLFYMIRVISLAITMPFVIWIVYQGYVISLTHALYTINLFAILSSVLLMIVFLADRVPLLFKSKFIKKLSIRELRESGSIFLYIGLATFLIQDIDFILLSFFLTPYQIAEFSLMHKFFQYSLVALSVMIVPLWPYLASAAELDTKSKNIRFYTYLLIFGSTILISAMLVISKIFLTYWGNYEFSYNFITIFPMALYFFLRCLAAIGALLLKLHIEFKKLLKHCLWEALFHALAVVVVFLLTENNASSITILVYLWCLITFLIRIIPVKRVIFQ